MPSIKLCSYNFVLNKAPNNSDVTHIASIVLNEAPNSNDAKGIANNAYLTTIGAQHISESMAAT